MGLLHKPIQKSQIKESTYLPGGKLDSTLKEKSKDVRKRDIFTKEIATSRGRRKSIFKKK